MSQEFLEDLFNRRINNNIGYENVRSVELWGGSVIEPTAFEPDPVTHRGVFYYNAITNCLYRKIITKKINNQVVLAHWKKISQ